MHWCSSISTEADSAQALAHALGEVEVRRLQAGLGDGAPDLVLLFASPHHADRAEALRDQLLRHCPHTTLLGCTAGGVAGGGREVERGPALALVAASLPDVALRAFHLGRAGFLPADTPPEVWHQQLGVTPDHAPTFLVLPDPFSCDGQGLAKVLDQAFPGCLKLGGLASGGSGEGSHALWVDDTVEHGGAACLALWGDLEVDALVAQGVRSVGPPLRVTAADRNYVLELDGQPAVTAFQELFAGLSQVERARFRSGPVVGLSVPGTPPSERPPGPHDWLVRNLIGMDPDKKAIGVGAGVHEGTWLRFMVRDAGAAADELRELLALYARRGHQPAAALLFSCLGRGEGLFGEPHHDTRLLREALGPVPVGGFFGNGELGPLHGRTILHSYTSSIGLVRARNWA